MISIWNNEELKTSRQKAGLSIKDASKALEITAEYLSMVENGHKQPSPKLLLKMSKIYLRPLSAFLKDEKNLAYA